MKNTSPSTDRDGTPRAAFGPLTSGLHGRMVTAATGAGLGLALLALPAAGDVALFLGAPGGSGDVRVADDGGLLAAGQPLALTGIELLPLGVTLHSPIDAWDPAVPGTEALPGGATALRLPGLGSLYRYRRAEASGASFGLFRIDPLGQVHLVLELPGVGPLGDQPPIGDRVAVDPACTSILVATASAAGGDLLELDLVQGTSVDRTAAQAPLDLTASAGLALTEGRGYATTTAGLVAFDRTPGAQAAGLPLVTPTGPATHLPGDLARAGDGRGLAVIAGTGPADEFVFVLPDVGAPVRVTDLGDTISSGGYLPEVTHGPFLALSTDSSHVGWRTETPVSSEGWLAATGVAHPPAQLTGDAVFLDTLDEIAPFAFFEPARLTLGVGELADPILGGSDSLDLFGVQLSGSGAPVYENLTGTSGISTPPFLTKPLISPEAVRRLPGTSQVLVQDDNQELLQLVSPGAPPVVIEPLARKLRFDRASGTKALLAIERQKPLEDMRFVVLDLPTGTWSTLALLPDDTSVVASASRGDGGLGVTVDVLGSTWTLALDLALPLAEATLPLPYPAGPTLDFDAAGHLMVSSGPAGVHAAFGRDPLPGVPVLLGLAPTPGFVLPR